MTAQDQFERLVRDSIWPFLRARGFKRARATFHRAVGDNWEVINVQKSQFSDRSSISFTVNLAVGIARLREGPHQWDDGKRPPESRCHLRERLGLLLIGNDVWWDIDEGTDVAALADTITAALDRYGLPWLEARSSEDELLAIVRSEARLRDERTHQLYWFAKLAAAVGEESLAEQLRAERERRQAGLGKP